MAATTSGRRPNILMIVTDEERFRLPRPAGFELPARERLMGRGTSFDRYYVASAQCSSSRSVIYTGRHMPVTQIFDNDNMPYIRPLDPELGTIGTMLRAAGYYTAYQGKWHLSRAYRDPSDTTPTTDALEPYGFSTSTPGATSTAGPGRASRSIPSSPARPCRGCAPRRRRSRPSSRGSWRRQLCQPARHHELRLRRPWRGEAAAQPC
ncbi:MAG: sulfatase-like hydrolase/transferase [Candidatus Nanopelagicales bacterium]